MVSEWQNGTNPHAMLEELIARGQPTARKLRLFACACVRREICYLLVDEESRAVVEVAERFADGEASERERALAEMEAFSQSDRWLHRSWTPLDYIGTSPQEHNRTSSVYLASDAAVHTVLNRAEDSARSTSSAVLQAMAVQGLRAAGWADQIDVLRDIFGPELSTPLPHTASQWLSEHEGDARKLAAAIYQGRHWQDLAVLADALEEGGCTLGKLLAHLRSPGPHVRGCWAVDAILGQN